MREVGLLALAARRGRGLEKRPGSAPSHPLVRGSRSIVRVRSVEAASAYRVGISSTSSASGIASTTRRENQLA